MAARGFGARVLALLFALAAGPAVAEPLPREDVPEPLRPWIDWVLRGHESDLCPFFENAGDRRLCGWPSRLALELGSAGGRFTQDWRLFRDGWVPLPGDENHWPEDVRADGKPASVALHHGFPAVRLGRGKHVVTGAFAWNSLPELLPIPAETGLVSLTLGGSPVAFPNREPQGQLWLQKRSGETGEEARLEVRVFRRLIDEVPLELVTRIELRVSGKNREALLARALPDGFVPMALRSPLPARLEQDGRLRVQLRAGVWTIDLTSRHEGPAASLGLPAETEGASAAEEPWVFEARPELRIVEIEGAPAIDPQQTELPADWRGFPAYLMRRGQTMRLVEKRRGDSDPPADQLALRRTWWLDFDGGGYTISDAITGTLSRSWRLEMPPPAVLGRVAIDGRDQLITRLADASVPGVEIRQGRLQIEADSRLADDVTRIAAVGWSHDFQQASGMLNVPPGWRLLYASGVDDVSSSWITDWTLLDLFLVLIIAMAAGRIWGLRWGAVSLVTLALTYHEPGAPRWLWLALLAGEALLSVLPAGRLFRSVRVYRFAVLVLLVMTAVPFAAAELRDGLYPALELPGSPPPVVAGVVQSKMARPVMPSGGDAELMELDRTPQSRRDLRRMKEGAVVDAMAPPAGGPQPYRAIDPNARISTGPGLPRWSWRTISLGWRGPVDRAQRIHLILASPRMNLFLAVVRIGALALLLVKALGAAARFRPPAAPNAVASAATSVALLVALAAVAGAADFPSAEMLQELERRLLDKPECFPSCASSPRMRLEASAAALVLRLEIDAAAETAVPLPAGARSWTPAKVALDAETVPALARREDGTLWIEVSPGRHQIVLEGPIPAVDVVEVPLPLKPHHAEVLAPGWTVEGLGEDGVPQPSLRLVRVERAAATADALRPAALPPFARIEREIRLGLSWEIENVLTRLTPADSVFSAAVPLLAGESVTTPDMRVEQGKIAIVLGPGASEARWHSVLKESAELELTAPSASAWTEVWRLDASPLWHVEPRGIPAIHRAVDEAPRRREWRPWPGERVALAITRPEGFPGQTLTIDHASLEMRPGLRATDTNVALEIRSSRGGQHAFSLPEGAELKSVTINGQTQPIRQERRKVVIPIAPAKQTIGLAWRQARGISARTRSPDFALGTASVNAETTIVMPDDRWILFAGGGGLGPAVLFWPILAVVALVAFALGRVRSTPLRSHHWFLLGVGLTQAPVSIALVVAGWLLALGWRRAYGREVGDDAFNLTQVILALWTGAALAGVFWSVQQGLLGLPEMQIAGNGSSSPVLRWYHDWTAESWPRTWVVSVPLFVYRLAMLAWALWLAWALSGWLRWGWGAFSDGGLWRSGASAWRLPFRRDVAT
ncbi:MAG: hypothetical protein ACREQQ_02735 [Candidatus Binatia bacterium]